MRRSNRCRNKIVVRLRYCRALLDPPAIVPFRQSPLQPSGCTHATGRPESGCAAGRSLQPVSLVRSGRHQYRALAEAGHPCAGNTPIRACLAQWRAPFVAVWATEMSGQLFCIWSSIRVSTSQSCVRSSSEMTSIARVMTHLNETEIHALHEALDGVWTVQTFKQILATS